MAATDEPPAECPRCGGTRVRPVSPTLWGVPGAGACPDCAAGPAMPTDPPPPLDAAALADLFKGGEMLILPNPHPPEES